MSVPCTLGKFDTEVTRCEIEELISFIIYFSCSGSYIITRVGLSWRGRFGVINQVRVPSFIMSRYSHREDKTFMLAEILPSR